MSEHYPVFIPSKGRAETCLTPHALDEIGVPYRLVVEPHEVNAYVARFGANKVIELDLSYKDEYKKLDNKGMSKSTGPGPARNFAWQVARDEGHYAHWVMDDNIQGFGRLHKGERIKSVTDAPITAMEAWFARYKNLAMAGPIYKMFAVPGYINNPFSLNTRIYSCNLIRNDAPFEWRGRYNEDTILSLDMCKAGWCTVQFYAFWQDKMRTQVLGGGNTDEFYSHEGTYHKSRMLEKTHPDLCRVQWRFGRWHHIASFAKFKKQKLVPRPKHEWPSYEPPNLKKVKVK